MSISPHIFLIIYWVLVGIFLILSLVSFYHVIRFGFSRIIGITATLLYLIVVALIILFTFQAISRADWRQPIEINLPFISSTNEGLK